jgi:clostripain
MTHLGKAIFFLLFCSFQIFSKGVSGADLQKKPWTVLVFLNADNNLEDFGYGDVKEMEKIGSNSEVNVVVQFDDQGKNGTQRLFITKADLAGSTSSSVGKGSFQSKVVENLPEQDMGDTKTLIDFTAWGMKNYPADHYMLIIWNHGSGWDKDQENSPVIKGVSYDDSSGNHISTNQLADALDQVADITGHRVDVLGFDACLMAMFEVADSLSGVVDYLVASEETEPGEGYPYDDFLRIFESTHNASPAEVARHLVQVYGKSYESGGSQAKSRPRSDDESGWYGYSSGGQQVTNAAIDLTKVELVKRRLAKWLQIVRDEKTISRKDLIDAAKATVSFENSAYKDLGDYVKNVLDHIASKDVAATFASRGSGVGVVGASLALLRAINDAIVETYGSSQKFSKVTGLSIYMPYSYGSSTWNGKYGSKKKEYMDLKWAQTTDWAKYLDYIFPPSDEDASQSSGYPNYGSGFPPSSQQN